MTIKSDIWIKEQAEQNEMIVPFFDKSIKQFPDGTKIPSYGSTSYGYDVRLGRNFSIFKNTVSELWETNNGVLSIPCYDKLNVDILDFDNSAVTSVQDVDWLIMPPHSFILAHTEEYLKIPKSVSVVCMNKSTWARMGVLLNVTPAEPGWCFTGDTKVALTNGTSVSLKEMVERAAKGERFFGYTFKSDNTIGIEELCNPRKTRENSELVEVTLDNGEIIRCTPDHKFLTKTKGYVEAQNLQENDSLMPLYRYYDKKGYESVASPVYNKSRPVLTHKLADQWNIDNGVYSLVQDTVRHHVDFRPINNYPTNIIRMTDKEHHRIHELKEGYSEERSKIGKLSIKNLFDRFRKEAKNDFMRFEEIVKEHYSEKSKSFWSNDSHSETKEKWLQAHKLPRPNRQKYFDEKEIWKAFVNYGSVRAAAKELKTKADTLFRRFPKLIAKARDEGLIPINHKVVSVKKLQTKEDVYCLTVPNTNNFALEAGVFVHNCGYLTLEISNTTNLPVKIWTGIGVVQLQFFQGDQECSVSYSDRNGKYNNQPKQPITARN